MPWNKGDAKAKTKRANTPGKQKQWAAVANSVLAKTGSEARAIRTANAVIRRRSYGLDSM